MYYDQYKNPAGLVSMGAFIRVGSIDETVEEKGYSHFLEHMLFSGIQDYPTTIELSQRLTELGCEFNAHTGYEYTAYHITCHKEYFNQVYEIFQEMLERPVFNEKDLEREKKVVCQEIELSENKSVLYKAHKKLLSMIYGKPALKKEFNILGSKKGIQSAQRKNIVDFWKKWYTKPAHKLIVISGDIEETLAEQKKGFFKKRDLCKMPRIAHGPKTAKTYHNNLGSSYIYYGFYTGDIENEVKKTIILELLLKYLCQSFNSLIGKSLRVDSGLSYSIKCLGSNSFFSYLSSGFGYKGFVVSISHDKINIGDEKVKTVIDDICTNGINKENLENIKKLFLIGFNSLMQTTLSRMFYFGTMAMKYTIEPTAPDIIKITKSITTQEFNELVCKVMSPDRRYCVIVTQKIKS